MYIYVSDIHVIQVDVIYHAVFGVFMTTRAFQTTCISEVF